MDAQAVQSEHRVRCYLLAYQLACNLFAEETMARVMRGVPKGARVLGVYTDYARHAFALMVEHSSFDVVAPGCEAPCYHIAVESISDEWPCERQWGNS